MESAHSPVVKYERMETEAHKGSEGETEPLEVQVPIRTATVQMRRYHCFGSQHPLKPPVYVCEGGLHGVCGACQKDWPLCTACNPATAYRPCPLMDYVIETFLVSCCYREYGCPQQELVYHKAADHEQKCAFAPCYCPVLDCNLWGSPCSLSIHLDKDHGWPITNIRYGEACKLTVPLPWRARHILYNKKDNRLFLVTLSGSGDGQDDETRVWVVCVQADTPAVRFHSDIWVQSPDHKLTAYLKSPMGTIDYPTTSCRVYPLKLEPEFGSMESGLCVSINIFKTDLDPSASASK